jgi:hypothetical protein
VKSVRSLAFFERYAAMAKFVIGVGVLYPDCPNHPNLTTEWKELRDIDLGSYTPNSRKLRDCAEAGMRKLGDQMSSCFEAGQMAARRTASLDKYIVMLSSGDHKEFWSIQLEKNSDGGV